MGYILYLTIISVFAFVAVAIVFGVILAMLRLIQAIKELNGKPMPGGEKWETSKTVTYASPSEELSDMDKMFKKYE